MKPLALLRWEALPRFITWDVPNEADLHAEDDLVVAGFIEAGLPCESVVWRRDDIDWSGYRAAIVRSTWDYIDHPAAFLAVLSSIEAAGCTVFNPVESIQWNIDKRYLFEMAQRGCPTIPTFRAADAVEALPRFGAEWAILKPTIGAAASNSFRVRVDEVGSRLDWLGRERPDLEYLAQPFIPSIETEGELSFVYFGGRLSHVLRRAPAAGDYRVQGIYGGSVERVDATEADIAQASAVLAAVPFDLLYARIDMIRYQGRLALMEVELIEPIMGFDLVPEGVARFAEAAIGVLGAGGQRPAADSRPARAAPGSQ